MHNQIQNPALPAGSSFNYTQYDLKTQDFLLENVHEIRGLIRATAQQMVEIGSRLIGVKQILGHGNFRKWIKSEFGWSYSTATKLMQVSECFKSVNFTHLNIAPSALYLLAAPSTPDCARDEALSLAKGGFSVNWSKAKQIIEQYKPKLDEKLDYGSGDRLEELDGANSIQICDLEDNLSDICQFSSFLIQREWARLARTDGYLSFILINFKTIIKQDSGADNLELKAIKKKIYLKIRDCDQLPIDFMAYYRDDSILVCLLETLSSHALDVLDPIKRKIQDLRGNLDAYLSAVYLYRGDVKPSTLISIEDWYTSLDKLRCQSLSQELSTNNEHFIVV